ncbi:hypothetical protein [Cellulomonas soli]
MRRVAITKQHVLVAATLLGALAAGLATGSVVTAQDGSGPATSVTRGE